MAFTAMILVIVFNTCCYTTRVLGESMAPTLQDQSLHLFLRIFSHPQEPEDGDIVIFSAPCEDVCYIKRVAAGPGESVIYNGQEITLGPDQYFVLGDNRDNSRDSRSFGPITRGAIMSVMIL